MKNLIVGDKPTVQRLADRLKRAETHSEYQRIQCVLIRATLGSSAAEIAQLLGWSVATVHVMHSRWANEGEAIFDVRSRGGRHHEYLTAAQEQQLLAPFAQRKVAPRPRHPKADVAAQAAFKKTAPRGTPRGLAPG